MNSPTSNIPGVPVSEESQKKFYGGLEAQREARAARDRKLAEPFDLPVGSHCKADDVVFFFKGYRTVGPVRYGGDNKKEEVFSLRCTGCGAAFDREHPAIDEAIKKHRDGL